MTVLSVSQIIDLTEVLVLLLGIAITWAVYYGSEKAELPGEASVPAPDEPDDAKPEPFGRTL